MDATWSSKSCDAEKTKLTVAFLPVLCSAPIVYAHSHGFFERNGLDVELIRVPAWSGAKNLLVYDHVDAAHMLSPMPLASTLGIDGRRRDVRLAAIQNVNGQALTLANKHKGIERAREMKGFTFGVPYAFSMSYYLLNSYLAAEGLNPPEDVEIKEVAPPTMPYYLEKGWIDGFLAPEPFNQIAVNRDLGFIHVLSKEIWDGHPCCCLATTQEFMDRYPNTYAAMLKSVLEAELALHNADASQRYSIAEEISDPIHLNQDDPVPIREVLTGEFPDSTGCRCTVSDRIDFIPHVPQHYGAWILSQMQRWGQLPGHMDYPGVVERVFDAERIEEIASLVGFSESDRPGISPLEREVSEQVPESTLFTLKEDRGVPATVDVPETIRHRLSEIVSHMAEVTGGSLDQKIDIDAGGLLGELQQVFNEMVLNTRFMRDSLSERNEKLRQEIMDRKRAEEAMSALLNAATDVAMLLDKHGNVLAINDRGAQFLRRTKDELIGFPIFDFMPPDLARSRSEKVLEVFRSGKPLQWEDDQWDLSFENTVYPVASERGVELVAVFARDITERKRAEVALAESEQRFRTAFEQAAVGIAHVAPDGGWLRVNQKLCDIVGYSSEDLLGLTFRDITYSDDLEASLEYVDQMLNREIDSYSIEKRYVRNDGSAVWCNVTVSLTWQPSGEPSYFIGVIEDISQRKEAEEAVKREKTFSDVTIDSLPGVFYLLNQDLRFLRWNGNFETATGYTAGEIPQLAPMDLFPDEEKNRAARAIQEVIETGQATLEADFVAKDGTRFPYLFTGRRLVLDNQTCVLGMGIDITDRKRAEEALRHKTYDLGERVKEMTCLYELFRLVETSPSLEVAFRAIVDVIPQGWQFPEITSARISFGDQEFRSEGYREPVSKHTEDLLLHGRKVGFIEVAYVEERPAADAGPFLKEEVDLLEAISDQLSLVIERTEAEAALQEHATALEGAYAELEQFAFISSHHLQEPLRKVINYAQLMKRRYLGQLDDRADKYIHYMVDGATRMRSLIEDLLNFNRLAKAPPSREPTDIGIVLQEVLKDLGTLVRRSGVVVTFDDLPTIEADAHEMRQVFRHLLSNAVKFRNRESPTVHVTAKGNEDAWLFSVSDNGIGIEEHYRERIFGVFQRLHSPDEFSGTGIGLAVCKKIVERHGGRIWVESEPGNGSTFCFTISHV